VTIRNPLEWGYDQIRHAVFGAETVSRAMGQIRDNLRSPAPAIRRISATDLKDVLARGLDDFGACRTDVIFLCITYPIFGLIIGRLAFGYNMLPLLFPLASGFALVGPFAAVSLYELSRQREQGAHVTWTTAFDVIRSPSIGAIIMLGLLLIAIFVLWLVVADSIYEITLGLENPTSIGLFIREVFTTQAGWALIGIGVSVGFCFALLVLIIGSISFPLLLDRNDVGLDTAIWTSVHTVIVNPGPMAIWGLVVAGGLIIGSIPLLLGHVIVMPVLGHATWHLYRKLVPR
jgi:uncharacterized membrane protein